jgi:N-acetylneuraminate synthase
MNEIIIDKKIISHKSDPYIISEIGANHNGDIDLAFKMIDESIKCGVDSVKFQSWTKDSLFSKRQFESDDQAVSNEDTQNSLSYEVNKYSLSYENIEQIYEYCDKKNITFLSSVFSNDEVDFLDKLGMAAFKIASMDINNLILLEKIATKNKPVLLSTGMSNITEISNAVSILESNGSGPIVLFHTVSTYPPDDSDLNLKNIMMLKEKFDLIIGFSDHTLGISAPLAAIALGAVVIEKHFTIDKNLDGWDHKMSATPNELEIIVKEGKRIKKHLGNYDRKLSNDEINLKSIFRRSIVASKDLKKDTVITLSDINFKRPGDGISPDKYESIIGKKLKVNKFYDDPILNSDFCV